MKKLIPQKLKNIYHLFQAILANLWYGFPSRKIHPHTNFILSWLINMLHSHGIGVGVKVIGITGSDGKTTTTQMVAKILEEAGRKVAMASTINFRINGEEEKNLSHYTTESSFAVQKFIKKSVDAGCEYLVLETSSHSLDQYRVWGVNYCTAVITNVTREHLDYHKTMESYQKAKEKLFEIVSKNDGTIIVNLDMENPDDFLKFDANKKFGYTTGLNQESGTKNQEIKIVKAEDIELGIQDTRYKISAQGGPASGWQDTNFRLNIPGMFNIENALAAVCVGLSENISLETISKALEKIKGIPGRMENVPNEKGLNIIVDFALTPNALEKLYDLIFSTKKDGSKIIAIFGSCGERDRGKRPIMGEIVSRYADLMIITNDEPYHEDPDQIIEEIIKGIKNKKENESFWKISDRRQAIRKALEISSSGDTIVITGMGNFETMVVGDEKIPWNDREVIEEELQKIK